MSAKQVLRKSVKAVLSQVSKGEIERQSKAIANALIPLLVDARDVACFMSMETGEVDTQYTMRQLFERGSNVYLPRCTSTRETGHVSLREPKKHHPHLTFHRMESWEQVAQLAPQGAYQLREPAKEEPAPLPAKLDIMLVPGVAFSLKDGARMGHGAGFYDDFFRRYQLQHNGSKPLLIGLSLVEQIVENIPLEPHDYHMNIIVTGDGNIHRVGRQDV